MFRMEVDSTADSIPPSNVDLILQRLSRLGVPDENLNDGQHGLVAFAKDNEFRVPQLVSAILPSDYLEEVEDVFRESLSWLQWLMFEGEPKVALEQLAKMSENERGVCGSVWGINDIAYRCRTCEHDPTCAICVPCFENGNHKDHDYSVIYTGGGCCDCGDVTAWKREGFCSKHRGAEQIQPLPENFAKSLGPVMDLLLEYWKNKLQCGKSFSEESPRTSDHAAELQKIAEELTSVVVEMLLDFCKQSESLLSFISGRVYSLVGLLDALLRAESFMHDSVVGKLHELLLKLLGEPVFKYEFAKVFVRYYPMIVDEAIKESSDTVLKKYPLLSTFSVQILTVPTLTPRLVEEMNLMDMLLQCLESIFVACARDDGRLEVVKWAPLYETSLRVVEDIRFVMSHAVVPKYLCNSRRDLVKMWTRLLASVQGMNAQKRETGNHIEEENENVHLPFVLCHSISNILSLLVAGAFSVSSTLDTRREAFFGAYELDREDQDSPRLAKVGRLSQESYAGSTTGKNSLDYDSKTLDHVPVPASALWLLHECLRSMEHCLGLDNTVGTLGASSLKTSNCSGNNFFSLKRTLSKFRRGRYMFKSSSISYSKLSTSSEAHDRQSNLGIGSECCASTGQEAGLGDHMVEGESTNELERLRALSSSDWPDITFDVSTQEISINIPAHRLLSMVLRTAFKVCYGESISSSSLNTGSSDQSLARSSDFLGQILEGCHPYGFSAFLMEHPLRIRVFCAEVYAGMWRRNGDGPILFCEWYRSVRWSEQGLELDLFLLQCCAALAPADLFIKRILARFGLADYLSLKLEQPSEHEPILVTEMLTLLIQIVKERRFCGLTTPECLQKELVYKLSIGDATRSQVVKSLPRDLSKVDKIQEVLDTVAEYSHPSGMTQGMYRLLSPYWKELDLYHPRWNSRDLQAAEERYSRFCNVSALTNQLPRWTKIYHPLRGLAKIATCRTLAEIVRAVLFYAVHTEKSMTSRAPDAVLLTGLHLLALALDVCRFHKESGDLLCSESDAIPFLTFANEEISTGNNVDQSMLSLLVSLRRKHEKENAENFMEAGKFSISSLVSSLLNKFAELEPICITKLQELAPESFSHFPDSLLNNNFKDTEPTSESEKLKAKSRERQAAILERMRDQQSRFLESFNSSADDEMDDVKSEGEVCDSETNNQIQESAQVNCSLCHDPKSKSPVSFLVLLQKSRLLSFVDKRPPSWEQVPQSGKEHVSNNPTTYNGILPVNISDGSNVSSSELIDVVQSALNDLASLGQPAEVDCFLQFVKARFPSLKNVQLPCMSTDKVEGTTSSLETFEERMYLLIKGSPSGSNNSDFPNNDGIFLASESGLERRGGAESLLLGKYIAALSKEPTYGPSASQNAHSRSDRMQSEANKWHLEHNKFGPAGSDGIYVSSCGHAVHQGCLDRYLTSLRERYIRRIVFEGGHIVDPDQGEFLCPVCRGLANAVLPALPGDLRKIPLHSIVSTKNFMDVGFPSTTLNMAGLRLQDALSLVQTAANVAGSNENLAAFPARSVSIISNLEPILRLLCGVYYPGQDKILETGRVSNSLILWDTLRYSLISTEIAARSRNSSLSSNYSLDNLYRELNSSSGFILSLLMEATQSIRTSNSLTVLLRLRGIQLCAKSLCYGAAASPDEYSSHLCQQGGSMLYILDNAEAEVQYPDTQLWRRLSEPILASDAFSSLMWTLFCLPWPSLSCKESYMSLVHAFYVVSVTQAILTYYRKKGIMSGLGCHDCLITDINKAVGEYGEVLQCFDSYYVDATCDIYDSIRSLTFPYLRRCALLWKLINSSKSIPFNNGLKTWDGSENAEFANNLVEELPEVEKLEKMFGIPPLSVMIADKTLRFTASRWLCHFSEVLRFHKSQCVVRCTPAVPFKLMHLPHLYQDLLQRYIKKRCPDCGALKEEPALCLLCGKLCSPSWKTCCRETGCQTHAIACGAGIGVFLLIRRTTILLQRSARQAPWPSPYLDAFGEEDVEMHRGKPLFLNEERYAALTHMVASHGLDRSSKVLRQTTTGSFFVF